MVRLWSAAGSSLAGGNKSGDRTYENGATITKNNKTAVEAARVKMCARNGAD